MQFILPAVISFLITVFAVKPTIKFANQFKLLDKNRFVPRAGGLPVFAGIVLSLLLFIHSDQTMGIIFGLIILLTIGLLDDKLPNFSPYLRLLCQFAAALTVVFSGIGIKF